MENKTEKQPENVKQKIMEKYGVWIITIGLVALVFVLKYILEYIEK